jgi:hypothetical protein
MARNLSNPESNGNSAVVPRPTGVSHEKQSRKYNAKIKVNGKLIWLGTFKTMQEASDAFEAAKAQRDKLPPKPKPAKPAAEINMNYLRRTKFSVELVKQIVRYEPEAGDFFWLERPLEMCRSERQQYWWNTEMADRKVVGVKKNGFLRISLLAKKFYAHHVAWAMVHGTWPTRKIIHINENILDNRISNLREADQ